MFACAGMYSPTCKRLLCCVVYCLPVSAILQDCFEGIFGADFMGEHAKPDAEAFQKASLPGHCCCAGLCISQIC